MLMKLWNAVSFGKHYLLASLIYLGLGLLLLSMMPGVPRQLLGQTGCDPGFVECEGDCMPEGWLCCDDGSFGDPSNCACCPYCVAEDPDTGQCSGYIEGIVCE